MEKTTIDRVLNEFDINLGGTMGIRYVRSDGDIGVISNATKPVRIKGPGTPAAKKDERSKTLYDLKYKGVVLLKNTDTGEFRSIKKANIIGFRPLESTKWLQVWH